jgi:hypothetical protein
MVTRAADALLAWILEKRRIVRTARFPATMLHKKASAVNGILGRASALSPKRGFRGGWWSVLAHDAGKNRRVELAEELGGHRAGGRRAQRQRAFPEHAAGILTSPRPGCGQRRRRFAGLRAGGNADDALDFSVTLPNLIVGTVGNGKGLPFVEENLPTWGAGSRASRGERPAPGGDLRGDGAVRRMSLLAAQTNPGELMAATCGWSAAPSGEEQVILVDADDREIGVLGKLAAHEHGGVRHRAFSVFVADPQGALVAAAARGGQVPFSRCGPTPAAAIRDRRNTRTPPIGACARSWLRLSVDGAVSVRIPGPVGSRRLVEHELDHVFTALRRSKSGRIQPKSAKCGGWRRRNSNGNCHPSGAFHAVFQAGVDACAPSCEAAPFRFFGWIFRPAPLGWFST